MGPKSDCKSCVVKNVNEIRYCEKMQEILKKATRSNGFGLRKRFPWGGKPDSDYLDACVSDKEKEFLSDIIKCIFKKKAKLQIQRVENPFLWGRYVLQYEEMTAELGSGIVEERIMVHVTSNSNAKNIAETNFDWRLWNRARFGKGVCFAKHAQYARQFASAKGTYIVSGVLVANSSQGRQKQPIPKFGDDTTTGKTGESVCVKYCDNDFYPYYIVQAL